MTTRDELHRLIDGLPESELYAAARYLEYLQGAPADPVLRALAAAPLDDEPETDEERAAVEEGREAMARGDTVRLEDLSRELGL